VIPGLQPTTAPVAGGDTAKSAKPAPAPSRPAAAPQATPAAVASKH